MSLGRPSGAPSGERDGPGISEFALSVAAIVRGRGSPLVEALERHRPGSREHAEATASYSFAGAVELGFDRSGAEAVREVARLHEIGKVYVPLGLLDKPRDELTGEERALLDSQFAKGSELARGAGIPDEACEWIRASGERFDGRGPRGLAGEAIPLESRIIRAACACDAVLAAPATETADGTPPDRVRRAIEELRGAAARELDPRVIDTLSAVLERTAP